MPSPSELQRQLQRARSNGIVAAAKKAAAARGLDPAVLLGIASRESRMGEALAADCSGDRGNALGPFQIDKRYHPQFARRSDRCDPEAGAEKAAEILAQNRREFSRLPAVVAAYNAGNGSVRAAIEQGKPPDAATTGGDYSSDVLRRAEILRPAIQPAIQNRAGRSPGAAGLLIGGVSLFALSQISTPYPD